MICPTCGIDALTVGGPCTYCTGGHLDRVKAEAEGAGTGGGDAGRDDIANVLNGSVAQVTSALHGVDDLVFLAKVKAFEVAGKNRKGVIAAIETRSAELGADDGEGD